MKTNIRFTFVIVKLIPLVLLSWLRSLQSSESNMTSFFTSSLVWIGREQYDLCMRL